MWCVEEWRGKEKERHRQKINQLDVIKKAMRKAKVK